MPASEFCCHFLNVTLWESVQWPGGRGQSPGQITMKKNCIARWRRTAENGWGRVRVKSQIPQGRRLSGHFLHITHTRHRHVSCPSEMFIKSTLQQLRLAVPTADIWTTPLHLPLPLPHKTPPFGLSFVATFYAFFQRLHWQRLLFQLQDKCQSIKACATPPAGHFTAAHFPARRCKKKKNGPSLTIRVSGFSIFAHFPQTANVAYVPKSPCPDGPN